jgi:integrase
LAWAEQLPSGNWRGGYRDKEGHPRYLDRTYKQEAEAKRLANKKEVEVREPGAIHPDAGKMTCGEWIDFYWSKRKVELGSQKRDESRLRVHILPRWKDVPLDVIDRDLVQEWVEQLMLTPRRVPKRRKKAEFVASGKRLAPSTVARIFAVFSGIMKAAVKARKIPFTPCESIEISIPEATDERFLDRDEVARLRAHAPDDLTRLFCDVAVGTGLRWGELAGLHRNRIDTKRLRIIVQEVHDHAVRDIKPYPKGRRRRGVPITKELARKLDVWMAENPLIPCTTPHRNEDQTRSRDQCRSGLLFAGLKGQPLEYNNFRRDRFDPMVAAAGLEDITPHAYRHTYASDLIQNEITIEQLSKLMGHKSILTTMRYAHLADAGWAKVREVLEINRTDEDIEEADLEQMIRKLALADPDRWSAVAQALDRPSTQPSTDELVELSDDVVDHAGAVLTSGSPAPHLLHEDDKRRDAKIIDLASRRRSAS